MTDVEIGAARVHLVVDASDYDTVIARALNSARGFGSDAEKAFDQASKGSRRAAANLLDYISNLGRASGEQARFATLLQKAAREGTDPTILKAGLAAWNKYAQGIQAAEQAARQLAQAQEEAGRINAAFDQQRAANAQNAINQQLGVGDGDLGEQARRRASAEAALLPLLQQQEQEYERLLGLAVQINTAWEENRSQIAQRAINEQLGVTQSDLAEQARRRADAEQALLPILEQQERAYHDMLALAGQIDTAFNQQRAQNAQNAINQQLGVQTGPRDAGYLAEQRAAVGRLQAAYERLGQAEAEAFAHNEAADRQIQQLQNLQATAGKTWYEVQKLRNAQLGISKVADPLVDKVRKQNEAMGAGTLTAKQYEFAMRGLPAQITDITVSLASGQNPLMVFLQQGGQLKDMFGGLKPAARALGGAIAGLINPYTLAAAAIGAIAFATYEATKRMDAFTIASAKSGGFAGTANELADLARSLNDIEGVSLSSSDDAVSKLAAGGLLAGENLRLAANAAAQWASATGDAVDTVTAKFEQIARSPLDALVKLNEAEHFLTQAQYDRIQALEAVGDTQQAVAEATKIYYDASVEQTKTVNENISSMSRLWRDLKDDLSDVNDVLGIIGNSFADLIEKQRKLPWWQRTTAVGLVRSLAAPKVYDDSQWDLTGITAASDATAAMTKQQTDAQKELQRLWDASGSKAEKYATQVKKLNAELANATPEALAAKNIQRDAAGNFSGAGYDRLLKNLQSKSSAEHLPSGKDATQPFKDQLATELAALKTQTQQIEIQYQQRQISVADYYDKLRTLAEKERDVTVAADNAQIAALAGKKDAERQIGTLRAANARANEQYSQRKMELDAAEVAADRQRASAMRDHLQTLKSTNDNTQRQMDSMVARVSMGEREYEIQQKINQVYQTQTQELQRIQNSVDDLQITEAEADKRRAELAKSTAISIKTITDGYVDLAEAQSSFLNGASAGWQDWLDKVNDVATQTKDIFTGTFTDLSSAIASGLEGDLSSFDNFFENLHKRILTFIAQQALTKFISSVFGGGKDSSSGETMGTVIDLFTSGFAKGGVPGGAGLAAYRNQIVSSPTVFPFARGGVPNVGVMGEVPGRSEGIFPLARTANGDLGVRVVESAGKRSVNLSQQFIVQGTPDRSTRSQMAKQAGRETSRALSRS